MEAVRTPHRTYTPYKGPHDTGRALLTYQGLTQTGMHSNSHTEQLTILGTQMPHTLTPYRAHLSATARGCARPLTDDSAIDPHELATTSLAWRARCSP